MTPAEWMDSYDTGMSSETIWFFMVGLPLPTNGHKARTPSDSGDFGRCYRLLEAFPEWRKRLPELGAFYPMWAPLVRDWERLELLYLTGKRREIHEALSQMEREARARREGR